KAGGRVRQDRDESRAVVVEALDVAGVGGDEVNVLVARIQRDRGGERPAGDELVAGRIVKRLVQVAPVPVKDEARGAVRGRSAGAGERVLEDAEEAVRIERVV